MRIIGYLVGVFVSGIVLGVLFGWAQAIQNTVALSLLGISVWYVVNHVEIRLK